MTNLDRVLIITLLALLGGCVYLFTTADKSKPYVSPYFIEAEYYHDISV